MFSLSPCLVQRTPIINNNNNNGYRDHVFEVAILILPYLIEKLAHRRTYHLGSIKMQSPPHLSPRLRQNGITTITSAPSKNNHRRSNHLGSIETQSPPHLSPRLHQNAVTAAPITSAPSKRNHRRTYHLCSIETPSLQHLSPQLHQNAVTAAPITSLFITAPVNDEINRASDGRRCRYDVCARRAEVPICRWLRALCSFFITDVYCVRTKIHL